MLENENSSRIINFDFVSFLHNYEFLGDNLLNTRKAHNYKNYMQQKYQDLFFEVSDDFKECIEVSNGIVFKKIENSDVTITYYNEDTGLLLIVPFFKFGEYVSLKDMVNLTLNDNYRMSVLEYFNNYKDIKNYDDYLISKSQLLLLKRN